MSAAPRGPGAGRSAGLLVSVYDKTGLEELVRGAGRGRRRDRLDRQHGRPDRVARRAGDPGRGADRLPGVRSTAGSRRCTRRCTRDCWPTCARPRTRPSWRARHRAVRPAGEQPLPVRRRRSPPARDLDECVEQIDIGGPAMVRCGGQEPRQRRGGDLARGVPDGHRRAGRGRPHAGRSGGGSRRGRSPTSPTTTSPSPWCA